MLGCLQTCNHEYRATNSLYHIRRLEALEDRTEALNQLVLDLGKSVEANTHAGQEQNASIERSFRELARGVQLIRDKQVCSAGYIMMGAVRSLIGEVPAQTNICSST